MARAGYSSYYFVSAEWIFCKTVLYTDTITKEKIHSLYIFISLTINNLIKHYDLSF